MSASNTSLSQAESSVNVLYYPANTNRRTRAAQASLTPEQVAAANEHAAKLRAQDSVLLRGPVEEGAMISIPSWRWNPELVAAIKSRPGYDFKKEWPYTIQIHLYGHDYIPTIMMPTWTVPAEPGRLDDLRRIYERVFACEIAQARATLRLAPLDRF